MLQPATSQEISSHNNFSEKATVFLHLDFLDGLRALAAIYVMLHHARLTVFYSDRQPDRSEGLLIGWLGYGHFAVDLFIVLSGFCLMIPVVRENGVLAGGITSFFKKRARRILPTYYAALVISVVFATTILSHKIGTIWDLSLPVTKMGIVAHLLLLQNIHRSMEINSVFWSIAVECQIYLLFPLIVMAWRAIGWQKTAVATIVISLTASILLQHTRLQGLTAHYLALFMFGMLGSTLSFSSMPVVSHYRKSIPWKGVSFTLFVLLVIICSFFPGWVSQYMISIDLLVGLCATTFIVAMSCDTENLPYHVLRWNPLVFIGTFSYSLYLLHMPLLQVLWQFVLVPLHISNMEKLLLLCLCGGPLVISVSYLFFLAFERPFISKSRVSTSADLATSVALSPAP